MGDCKYGKGMNLLRDTIIPDIEKHGVAIIGVHGTAEEPETFAYTVGMTARGLPEIIVFGLPASLSAGVLNSLAKPLLEEENPTLSPGQRANVLQNGVPVHLIPARPERAANYVTAPGAIYGPENVRVLQMCLPDKHGAWPWDYHTTFPQTMLGPAPTQGIDTLPVGLTEWVEGKG